MISFKKAVSTIAASVTLFAAASSSALAGEPASSLLTPDNHTVILIDHQPQMAFATASHEVVDVRNNVCQRQSKTDPLYS
jgi:hypothetical protein